MTDDPKTASGGWPQHDDDEIAAVTRVLRSGLTNYRTGTEGRAFEAEFARYVGMPYGVALANGTVALELALLALGVGPGDEVIVPSTSFVATASCVLSCGANPVFADVSAEGQTLDAATVAGCIGPRSRAIIAVHLYGRTCPMRDIVQLAKAHDLWVIEDCAQAHGALLDGRRAGSFGDAAAFSFCQDKILSTGGEGGMLLLRSPDAARIASAYRDHGKREDGGARAANRYRWVHESPGTNWRLTEMQSAIGRVQLQKLDGWLARRRAHADLLLERLSGVPGLVLPGSKPGVEPAWYRFPLRLQEPAIRDVVVDELGRRGVACGTGVCPELYRERALESFAPDTRRANAAAIGRDGFCLSLSHTMIPEEIGAIARELIDVLKAARRTGVQGL